MTPYTITGQGLLQAGYKKVKPDKELAEGLFQKKIEENGKTRYFINFYTWDLGRYINGEGIAASVEVNLHAPSINPDHDGMFDTFQVMFYVTRNSTIKEVEAFYENMYRVMNCIPDPHN